MKVFSVFSPFKFLYLIAISVSLSACGNLWVPTGGWQGINQQAQCEAVDLEKILFDSKLAPSQLFQATQDFIRRCEKDITRDSSGAYVQLFKFAGVRYDYMKNRQGEAIDFVDLEGRKARMALFMKTDAAPRPMVIVKCGLQCDPGSTTLAIMLMNLYDEGPFNVLLVPSMTGPTYQRDNRIMALGGFDEGRQLLKLARWVQSPDFKYFERVTEVHVAGVSLGGSAALYSALYATHNLKPDGSSYVRSVFAGCPVVDLEKSIEDLYDGGLLSKLYKRGFWGQVHMVADHVPFLHELFGDGKQIDMWAIPDIISRGALDYYKRATLDSRFNLAPFRTEKITTIENLWDLNRFQNFASLNKVPVFVWAADNDKVVSPFINADLLKSQDPNVYNLLRTDKGNHCMFSDSYSWRVVGTVIRGIFVSQSESLSSLRRTRLLRLTIDQPIVDRGETNWFEADRSRKTRGVQWRSIPQAPFVELLAFGRKSCRNASHPKKSCEEGYSIQRLPYNKVGLSLNDKPQNEVEAQALTRWMNSNIWVWGAERGRLDPEEEPRQIEVRSFGERL